MAHWAELDENNIVVRVAVGNNDEPDEGQNFFQNILGGNWVKTSFNTRGGVHYNPDSDIPSDDQSKALRKNYALIGFTYDESRDAFIPPQDFPSWTLNEQTCLWEAPTPYPEDGRLYAWNESELTWDLVPIVIDPS